MYQTDNTDVELGPCNRQEAMIMKSLLGRAMQLAFVFFFTCSEIVASETITYIHLDVLGSPVAATNGTGNVLWRETYQPYGERIRKEAASNSNNRWYTGHPQDPETGLVYAGARYYDPVIGRFMAVDPANFTEKNPHSFNRYAYGNNNPYRYVDPDGNVPVDTVIDAGFVIYDFGQFLGAGAAYAVGAITGNQALMAEGRAGLAETSLSLGGSLTGFAIPYVSAGVTRGVVGVIPDSAVVVRGGTKELPPPGQVFSGAAGKTLEDAAAGVPHGQIRATTAGEIRAAGGTVIHKPEQTRTGAINEKHVNICLGSGPCPFGPIQQNPVPKSDRIQ
jgi:RHS repeat-associated protein